MQNQNHTAILFFGLCLLIRFLLVSLDRFKGIPKDIPVVSFSSKKLQGMGFKFKYSLEDMFRGAVDTCREKGLLPYSNEATANGTT